MRDLRAERDSLSAQRSNWDHATDPRPERECPHCGEDRLVEQVGLQMVCMVCALTWRVPQKKD